MERDDRIKFEKKNKKENKKGKIGNNIIRVQKRKKL